MPACRPCGAIGVREGSVPPNDNIAASISNVKARALERGIRPSILPGLGYVKHSRRPRAYGLLYWAVNLGFACAGRSRVRVVRELGELHAPTAG